MTIGRGVVGGVLFSFALWSSSAVAAPDLAKYPCTVFNPDICFRLPSGTSLEYSVPSDFHLYVVSKGGVALATLYVGNAPSSAKGDAFFKKKTSRGGIEAFRREEGSTEIVILPTAETGFWIQIVVPGYPDTSEDVRAFLSSIRPCRHIRTGGQRCPTSSVWSRELLQIADDSALPGT